MVEQGAGPARDVTTRSEAARPPWWRRLPGEVALAGRAGVVLAVLAGCAALWWSAPAAHAPALALVAAAGVLLAVVDARTHRLPDAILLPAWAACAVLLGCATLATGDTDALVRATCGAAAGFTSYALLRLAHPPGLGFGDVKLAGLLGTALAWLGWSELVVGLVAPFVLGGFWAVALLALRRATRSTAVPFGPFMVVGAALAAVAADVVVGAYAFA
ncbi:prepilin peptidase [Cellulosimicrobium marinum]|uniref:prepilin peptidase n=1 Tax=Cellulosimicrobium marinum TaxID=1638992 RepID=UPI001E2DEF22|nr:A24 family peptidase [Cellulosimicrobium marinum]MCB7137583.1 A24 family peptidase [Cellulosimicrobium marinum]